MPEKQTVERAREDAREGKSPSTQAGEFVHEEMHHVREGKYGAASPKQALAIGLSKARRAGVKLPSQRGRNASLETKEKGERDSRRGQNDSRHKVSAERSIATSQAVKRRGTPRPRSQRYRGKSGPRRASEVLTRVSMLR